MTKASSDLRMSSSVFGFSGRTVVVYTEHFTIVLFGATVKLFMDLWDKKK